MTEEALPEDTAPAEDDGDFEATRSVGFPGLWPPDRRGGSTGQFVGDGSSW